MNSPWRIPTIKFLLDYSYEINKVFFHEIYPPAKQLRCTFLQHFKALALLSFSSTTSKNLSLLNFLHNLSL